MAAPKGNKFWLLRSSHGPNPKFDNPDDLWNASCEYFEWVVANPLQEERAFAYQGIVVKDSVNKMRAMTLIALQTFLDISHTTWGTYKERQDLLAVTNRIDNIIRSQKFEGAAAELLNPNIIARDLGLSEKTEIKGNVNIDPIKWVGEDE